VKIADTYIPLINPNITTRSEDTDSLEEGCLSLPGIEVSVSRPLSISLTFIDKRGDIQERSYAGLPARIIQHEVDHLNGVLIVDYETSI
jgi:peptide deformylase